MVLVPAESSFHHQSFDKIFSVTTMLLEIFKSWFNFTYDPYKIADKFLASHLGFESHCCGISFSPKIDVVVVILLRVLSNVRQIA